ncbi:hypothetical protein D4Q71_17055 [Rhodopseudomonas palustris]|nr:hypothetical protein B1S06_09560 [Rhodopseudomonas palustris]RJF62566.1 hypothetical protein D4Q71_17055 [Rhodopseudomonas palustris]
MLGALRNGVIGGASAAHARRPIRSLAAHNKSDWFSSALRMSTSWLVTFALLLQIALSVVPPASAASLDVLSGAGICHSIDTSAPADSQDRVVVHFKCIACVLVCSLPPPSLVVTAAPSLTWAWLAQRWPLTEAAPSSAPVSSHSARGPPDLA